MLNCLNKMRMLTLLGAAIVLVSASESTLLAEDASPSPTSTPAPTANAAPTAAEAAAPAAPATVAPPATSPTPSAPAPTLEQRVAGLEAYVTNGDPTAALKDKEGNIPKDLTMATVGTPGPGHNGWMMTSSALVLFMTLPGLALFYGGLVRRKNVLSVLAQCFGITGLVAILWWAFGYSLVFGKSFNNPFYGGSEYFFLAGVNSVPNTDYAYWVSQNVYAMYQLMFAIITPALIIGAIAERMKYWTLMIFMALWMFLVYFPLAHMVWGITGFMNGIWNPNSTIKAIDFAGGTVVHMSSGWSALILCLILGPRRGFNKEPMRMVWLRPCCGWLVRLQCGSAAADVTLTRSRRQRSRQPSGLLRGQ
jgi:Amt family ammonium transporter